MFPRPVAAEGLLYRTTCLVRSLLAVDCRERASPVTQPEEPANETPAPASPQPTPAPTSSGSNPTPSTDTPSQQGTQNGGSAVAPSAPAPIKIDGELPTPLSGVAPVEAVGPDQKILAHYIAMNVPAAHSNAFAVLGASDNEAVPIKATPEGWVVLGIAWYWWLLLTGVAISGITILAKRGMFKKILSIAR